MNTSSENRPDPLPGIEELFSLPALAAALGVCPAEAWGRVQEALAALAAGQAVAAHLRPARWVRKGNRRVVLFTADQLAAARAERAAFNDN